MGWGKEWPLTIPAKIEDFKDWDGIDADPKFTTIEISKVNKLDMNVIASIDLGSIEGDSTVEIFGKLNSDGTMKITKIKETKNLKPTHDPYTNPNAHIYYECSCGAILDPQTKSFAQLNNHASEAGWKIRFGETGYTPYCVKCGEGVE